MQSLTCSICNKTWERPAKRGRPPKKCPECVSGASQKPQEKTKPAPKAEAPAKTKDSPGASQSVKPKRRKTAYDQLSAKVDNGPLDKLPFASRTSGWCTDYDPNPEAQHEKCDGDLGKYRCPCECHGWKDAHEIQ